MSVWRSFRREYLERGHDTGGALTLRGHVKNNEANQNHYLRPTTTWFSCYYELIKGEVHFSYIMTILSDFCFIIFNLILRHFQSLLNGPGFLDFWFTPFGSNFSYDNAFLGCYGLAFYFAVGLLSFPLISFSGKAFYGIMRWRSRLNTSEAPIRY